MAAFISEVTRSIGQFTHAVSEALCPALPGNPANDAAEPHQASIYTEAFEENFDEISEHVQDLLKTHTEELEISFSHKLNLMQKVHNQEIIDLNDRIKKMEEQTIAKLTDRVNIVVENTASLTDSAYSNMKNIDRLTTRVDTVKTKITNLSNRAYLNKKNIEDLTTRVDTVDENATTLTRTSNNLTRTRRSITPGVIPETTLPYRTSSPEESPRTALPRPKRSITPGAIPETTPPPGRSSSLEESPRTVWLS